jgi:TetR/AcrR family transcriptional regulator, cholesterol catabolism regulator
MSAAPRNQPSDKPARNRRAPAASDSKVQPLHQPRRRREREVLDVAARLFHERGYADTSVQDIADELGILKGSLYHYIEVKEDLLFRLLEQLHDDTQALMEEVAATQGLTPLEQLVLYVRAQLQFDLENLPRVAVYYNDYERLSPARRAVIVARRRLHERWVSDVIERAQADGEADPELDAPLLSNFIHGAVIWTYRWYKPRGRVSRDKIADTCAAFVLRGVVGEPANGQPEAP